MSAPLPDQLQGLSTGEATTVAAPCGHALCFAYALLAPTPLIQFRWSVHCTVPFKRYNQWKSVCAGFSWQVHAASLKAMQALVHKLQAASRDALPQEQATCIAGLLPGTVIRYEHAHFLLCTFGSSACVQCCVEYYYSQVAETWTVGHKQRDSNNLVYNG